LPDQAAQALAEEKIEPDAGALKLVGIEATSVLQINPQRAGKLDDNRSLMGSLKERRKLSLQLMGGSFVVAAQCEKFLMQN